MSASTWLAGWDVPLSMICKGKMHSLSVALANNRIGWLSFRKRKGNCQICHPLIAYSMIPADRSTVPWLALVYAHPYPLKGDKLLGNCPFCMNFIGWVERTVCTDCSRGGRGFGGRATEKRICCQRQCSAFCWYTIVAIRERLNCIELFSYRLD